MTVFLLQICAGNHSLLLLNNHRRLNRIGHHAFARASIPAAYSAVVAHSRLRRVTSTGTTTTNKTPSVPSLLQHHHHKRSVSHGRCRSLDLSPLPDYSRLSLRRTHRQDMASHQEIRRRPSAADASPVEMLSPTSVATTTTFSSAPDKPLSQTTKEFAASTPQPPNSRLRKDSEVMPPPPLPPGQEGLSFAPPIRRHHLGHMRGHSTTSISRQANRLSLTLPIALPKIESSRHGASASTSSITSVPQTPVDALPESATSDPNDFIIAIAAQERKVLELREELSRAEAELTSLKKQWASKEAFSKRAAVQPMESPRATPVADDMSSPTRGSIDFDRRKMLLQNQSTPSSPSQGRRKVLRGGHTRTLSLLSPVRKDPGFAVLEDKNIDSVLTASQDLRFAAGQTPMPQKRSTWQPRTAQPNASSVPQIMEDFKLGLRAFVEDIRQITVGDEPVSGQGQLSRTLSSHERNQIDPAANQDRSKTTRRPKTSSATDDSIPNQSNSTSITGESIKDILPVPEKAKAIKQKHFSWTPLGFETLDDNDWTNWESPMSTKSARWSGSTVHSAGLEDVQTIPENGEISITPSKLVKSVSREHTLLSPKLEELLPSMVNKLSPSNIKRTANHLLDEWEKSLIAPEDRDKENVSRQSTA